VPADGAGRRGLEPPPAGADTPGLETLRERLREL
jgi:hypothetical protein